jgi:hypothetical protein
MTSHDERDPTQPGLDPAEQAADRALTAYAEGMDENPAPGFTDWVMRSVASEPLPKRGFLAALGLLFATPGPTRRLAQAAVAVLILAVAVGTTYGIARVGGLLPDGSPAPSISPSPSPSAEPSETPAGSGTPSPSPTPDPSDDDAASATPDPSDDDHDASESPEPSDTPEPGETPDSSDNSGSD